MNGLKILLTDESYTRLKDERFKANIQLLELLRSLVYTYPDLRFSQILGNFDFVIHSKIEPNEWRDEYHIEPRELLERVKQAIEKVNQG